MSYERLEGEYRDRERRKGHLTSRSSHFVIVLRALRTGDIELVRVEEETFECSETCDSGAEW